MVVVVMVVVVGCLLFVDCLCLGVGGLPNKFVFLLTSGLSMSGVILPKSSMISPYLLDTSMYCLASVMS